jgi:hypothetical protein
MDQPAPFFRRKVFYIPGFDPNPPRRYREIYRAEGAKQAAWSGYDLSLLSSRAVQGQPYTWRAEATISGAPAQVDIEVLVWADIVKASMPLGLVAIYGQVARTAWIYLASGALAGLVRLRKGPAIAATYPALFLLLQAALVMGAAIGFGAWGAQLHPAGAALGLLAGWGALRAGKAIDRRIGASYLMQDFAFAAQDWGAYPPLLAARMDEFAAKIRASLDEPFDEVLVVGHSSGAYMGVSVLADVLRAGGAPTRPQIGLLTLGQVVPMVSFLPRAHRLRRDLHDLSCSEALTWVDVTAPGDGCAFALCDPVAVSGVAPQSGHRWPIVLSCAFRKTLSAPLFAQLRWRFFRLHFQYIHAFDRAGQYDYFAITAGPISLAQRFGAAPHSPQRITQPQAKHREMA